MFNCDTGGCNGNCVHNCSGLTSGQPILHAEGQFVVCHFSPSQFVPFRKVGRRHLKEILRRAITNNSDKQASFKTKKKEKSILRDKFEMIDLSDSCNEEETSKHNASKKTTEVQNQQQQQQKRFSELLQWIAREGKEFVHIETFLDLKEVFTLLDVIASSRNPVLTTVLIRETEPSLVTVSISNVNVELEGLLFCMFQA